MLSPLQPLLGVDEISMQPSYREGSHCERAMGVLLVRSPFLAVSPSYFRALSSFNSWTRAVVSLSRVLLMVSLPGPRQRKQISDLVSPFLTKKEKSARVKYNSIGRREPN
jgi:hypothetical protein